MHLRRIVESRWFALADLFLILGLTGICILEPEVGRWLLMIGLLPGLVRSAVGRHPFQKTPFDLLIAVFVITAFTSIWAAYDKSAAWNKAWLIAAALLIFRAVSSQPRENLLWVCGLFFLIGLGVSVNYFLSYDFAAAPRKLEVVNQIGRWLMSIRPRTGWMAIHPNYVGGLAAITAPFVILPLRVWGRPGNLPRWLYLVPAAVVSGILMLALIMTTSRGALMAAAGGLGVWVLWKLIQAAASRGGLNVQSVFPLLVLVYLGMITAFLYLGPASKGTVAENYHFGNGSREELFARSLFLVQDYPFTGGGLGSFPGLYSRYILNIPYFNVPNSHNLFLDVSLEQGLFGGAAFLLLYLASIWRTARSLAQKGQERRLFAWAILFALTVATLHGLVDDYLYNGDGTALALILPAFSMAVVPLKEEENIRQGAFNLKAAGAAVIVIALVLLSNPRKSLAAWYANLGAVKMARVDLEVFPGGGWVGPEVAGRMGEAERALQAAVELDPGNRTANQRLGMISMLRQDFISGSTYLSEANRQAPDHRGVLKSLGFCLVWQGDLPRAKELLASLPEAREELDAYVWWWGTQGRPDLSAYAAAALQSLEAASSQP